jgi:hypothetical protein
MVAFEDSPLITVIIDEDLAGPDTVECRRQRL